MTDETWIPEQLGEELEGRRKQRRQMKSEHKELFAEVSAIFFRHDPIGINFETNTDEYEPETGTVLARLKEAGSARDLGRIIHEVFVLWFSPADAGPESRYTVIANDVWEAWQRTVRRDRPGGGSSSPART